MSYVFIFTDIEIPITGREMALCVLENAQSQTNMTVHHASVREFIKQSRSAMQIWARHKNSIVCAGTKDLDDQSTSEEKVERVSKKILQSQRIRYKKTSGNQNFTNMSLAHPEETLDNETLQAATRSVHNSNGQAKAQTELTCAVSQAYQAY